MIPFLPPLVTSYATYALPALALVALLIVWRLRWRDYALAQKYLCPQPTAPAAEPSLARLPLPDPEVSVIVPCLDQAEALRQLLPLLFEQDLPRFEIIVADEASTDETGILVEHLSQTHPELRYTRVPASSKYIDRRKLAVTLGVRAARSPWCVILPADCIPAEKHWLSLMSTACRDDINFILGYANWHDDHTASVRRAIYERLRRNLMRFRAARRRAFGGDFCNFAFRRDWFLSHQGYAASLTYRLGYADLLIDDMARTGDTAVIVNIEAGVWQSLPRLKSTLKTDRLSHRKTHTLLSRSARRYFWRESVASWASWLFILSILAFISLRTTSIIFNPTYPTSILPFDLAVLILLVAFLILPYTFLRRTCAILGERRFSAWTIFRLDLLSPFRTFCQKLKFLRHRHDFGRR
ncbi:MAG: glycosyltransferase [Alloprevotella sp.]